MTYLIIGLLLWSFLHFMPAVPLGLRTSLVGRMGEGPYKGLSGIMMLASIILIILGWKSAPSELLYEFSSWAEIVCGLGMLVMTVTLFAPYMPTNIKRYLRHPQLFGFMLFGFGHVLTVGQVRGVVLFGWLGVWALVEMVLINRRDGAWEKPERVSVGSDLKLLLVGVLFYMLFVFIHEAAFGVSVLPG